MQDTPLKPFRPTVKVLPFNYHSIADALHFDVKAPDGWPKRKCSRGTNKLLLQEEGTIRGMSLDAWIDWLHHIWCAIFTTSVQNTSNNCISKPLVRPALLLHTYFHGNLLPRRWGQPILPEHQYPATRIYGVIYQKKVIFIIPNHPSQ